MEVRDAIKLAVDHLADAGAPEEVASRLVEGGYSSAKAEGLSAACLLACETAREASSLDLAQLQETLTTAGTRADLAALIAVEVFSEQSPELRLGEVAGVPVLQLLGDLCRLSPDERLAIREELLEPLFARDSRLLVDLGGLSDAPLEVFGVLCSDIATLRAAGGDLVLTGLDAETSELASAYRLAEVIPIASDPQAALDRLGKLPVTPATGKRFVVLRGEAEGAGILAIRGAIDARSVERAERKVRKVLAKHPRLVLDLREVPWISPEGFAFLRAITAELGERIKVARILGLAAAAAQAEKLSQAITIYADRREALDAFGPAPVPASPGSASPGSASPGPASPGPASPGSASPGPASLESEDLASDEVVEVEDPAVEKAVTQAAPAANSPVAPAPEPEPACADKPGPAEASAPKAKAKTKRPKTKRQASEQRKRDLEAAKLKAAKMAKEVKALTPEPPAPEPPAPEPPAPEPPAPEPPAPEPPAPEPPAPEPPAGESAGEPPAGESSAGESSDGESSAGESAGEPPAGEPPAGEPPAGEPATPEPGVELA